MLECSHRWDTELCLGKPVLQWEDVRRWQVLQKGDQGKGLGRAGPGEGQVQFSAVRRSLPERLAAKERLREVGKHVRSPLMLSQITAHTVGATHIYVLTVLWGKVSLG